MVPLATVRSTFHARVIAARLGAEGFVTELRGNVDGIYPMGDVHVYVDADDLESARELLLADEVESVFDDPDERRPHTTEAALVAGGSCGRGHRGHTALAGHLTLSRPGRASLTAQQTRQLVPFDPTERAPFGAARQEGDFEVVGLERAVGPGERVHRGAQRRAKIHAAVGRPLPTVSSMYLGLAAEHGERLLVDDGAVVVDVEELVVAVALALIVVGIQAGPPRPRGSRPRGASSRG